MKEELFQSIFKNILFTFDDRPNLAKHGPCPFVFYNVHIMFIIMF